MEEIIFIRRLHFSIFFLRYYVTEFTFKNICLFAFAVLKPYPVFVSHLELDKEVLLGREQPGTDTRGVSITYTVQVFGVDDVWMNIRQCVWSWMKPGEREPCVPGHLWQSQLPISIEIKHCELWRRRDTVNILWNHWSPTIKQSWTRRREQEVCRTMHQCEHQWAASGPSPSILWRMAAS